MGHLHTISARTAAPSRGRALALPLLRATDLVVASLLLLLAAPLMALLALAVRASSHGPILHRERLRTVSGSTLELLSFRTMLDGGGTDTHVRLRAVVGAGDDAHVTPVGRILQATRLEHLPRLINVVAGHRSLFGRRG
jgi:lipopolysaccharide/colanic/teichoic acid biosynthesis glycosyltransferase